MTRSKTPPRPPVASRVPPSDTQPADPPLSTFAELGLIAPVLQSLQQLGYEAPSPIQAATIPLMLLGRDILGQAQTGTGKTAAFALPILSRLKAGPLAPQALVLVPTRELALQVAEAFARYASRLPGFHVLPIYGGQAYGPQLAALRRGVHVVVGTPGRIIDHLERGTLDVSALHTLVLDEADEMLRMGFIEEVERILRETPASRQTALFSATLPAPVRRIAQQHLRDAADVMIASRTHTAQGIRQRYWQVSGMDKLEALVRILEGEPFDGMIVFSRTKLGADDIATRLIARGFSAAAIHGDMQQAQRERTVEQLRTGAIDILVATDVAARGLDVERISHVVNIDVPSDPQTYTHRIGRTGRAGRSGEAIVFVTPSERGLLKAIERATRQTISLMQLPTLREVHEARSARLKARIHETLAAGGLDPLSQLIAQFEGESGIALLQIASALARMLPEGEQLLLERPRRERDKAPGMQSPALAPEPAAAGVAPPDRPARSRRHPSTPAGAKPKKSWTKPTRRAPPSTRG